MFTVSRRSGLIGTVVAAVAGGLLATSVGPAGGATPSFAPTVNYPTTTEYNPWQVVVGDFNRDGIADLAVANPLGGHPSVSDGGYVSVLLGTGGGSFGPPTHFIAGEGPHSVAVGDFNEDGIPDLVTANAGPDNVSLLLGTGTGSFGAPINFPIPAAGVTPDRTAHFVIVGDFNRDGFDDLAVTVLAAPSPGSPEGPVSVLLGTGTASFGAPTDYPAGYGTTSVAVGDFNEDGIPDLVVTNLLRPGGGDLAVLLGTGDGTFGPATHLSAAGINPNAVVVGDFNGDGFDDLAVAMFDGWVTVRLGVGDGTFNPATTYPMRSPRWVAVGDFDGDGILDLAVARSDTDDVAVLSGTGTGTFAPPVAFPAGDRPFYVAVGDLNGDGRPDLAVANNTSRDVSILLNTTGQGPTTTTSTSTTSTSTTIPPTTTTSTSTTTPPTTTTSTSTTVAPTTTTSTSTTIRPTTTTPPGTCGGLTPTIVGTSGNDSIFGTPGPDVIAGGGGYDSIRGLGGNDVICGGDGNDQILGGEGNDRVFGDAGNDQLWGEIGDDTIAGGTGADRLSGGDGADSLNGDADADQCLGDAGTDTASTCESVIGVP